MATSRRYLHPLAEDFKMEASQIEDVFLLHNNSPDVSGYKIPYRPVDDGCVVALWDSWNRYLRSLIIASCASSVVGISGTIYNPPTSRNETETLDFLRNDTSALGYRIRTIRGEPSWYELSDISDIANSLELPNARIIVDSVTSSQVRLNSQFTIPNPIGEIKDIRNFIAHKNEATYRVLRNYVPSKYATVSQYLRSKRLGGVTKFEEWISGLKAISVVAAS